MLVFSSPHLKAFTFMKFIKSILKCQIVILNSTITGMSNLFTLLITFKPFTRRKKFFRRYVNFSNNYPKTSQGYFACSCQHTFIQLKFKRKRCQNEGFLNTSSNYGSGNKKHSNTNIFTSLALKLWFNK